MCFCVDLNDGDGLSFALRFRVLALPARDERRLRALQKHLNTGKLLSTNDRLCHLFHAGYIDRPRAQLDYYPTADSAPIVYALADRGARLLSARGEIDLAHIEWSWKNREAGRPFIEHQLEIVDFKVAMELAAKRVDHRFVDESEIVSPTPRTTCKPFEMLVMISRRGARQEIGLIPDLAFAFDLNRGASRNFLVEIDRGTMPITRADFSQTSVERKRRCYLADHAALFGWNKRPRRSIKRRLWTIGDLRTVFIGCGGKGTLSIPVYLGDSMQLSISQLMADKELVIRVPPPRLTPPNGCGLRQRYSLPMS